MNYIDSIAFMLGVIRFINESDIELSHRLKQVVNASVKHPLTSLRQVYLCLLLSKLDVGSAKSYLPIGILL